jgi:hypothetical protein
MKRNFKFIFAGIGAMLAMVAAFGAVVMLLWNALIPQIFALPTLNYWQAAGLLLLARLLLGGWRGHAAHRGARHPFHHGNKLREKWMSMSEEERKEFIEKEKDFFDFHRRCSHPRDPFHNDEKDKKDEGSE